MLSSSSTVTLARSSNPIVSLTSSSPRTWVINSGVYHTTANRGIISLLNFTLSHPSLTLENDFICSREAVGTASAIFSMSLASILNV